ncbi:hypothetical protein K1719_034051 [Acacia pycnantha]|nr:hypothetical protein K1719_034051 [Acacia pycnantha]
MGYKVQEATVAMERYGVFYFRRKRMGSSYLRGAAKRWSAYYACGRKNTEYQMSPKGRPKSFTSCIYTLNVVHAYPMWDSYSSHTMLERVSQGAHLHGDREPLNHELAGKEEDEVRRRWSEEER